MDHAIKILNSEIQRLEKCIRQQELMQQNRKEASAFFSQISQLKRAIKHLKNKQATRTNYSSTGLE